MSFIETEAVPSVNHATRLRQFCFSWVQESWPERRRSPKKCRREESTSPGLALSLDLGLIQIGSSRTELSGWAPLLQFYKQHIHKNELSGQLFSPELSAWTISIPLSVDFIVSGHGWQRGRSIREMRAGFGALPAKWGLAAGRQTHFVLMPAGSYITPSSWADNGIIKSAPTFCSSGQPLLLSLSAGWK